MTTIQQLITKLYQLDVKLALQEGKLTVSAPAGLLTADLRAELATHKTALVAFLEEQQTRIQPIPRADYQAQAPLSFAQQRLWFLEQIETTGTTYHLATLLQLTGTLRLDALQQSLSAVVARHEILRTTYAVVDGVPMQCIAEAPPVTIAQIDYRALPLDEKLPQAIARIQAEQSRRFDLTVGPLWRFLLFRLGAQPVQEHPAHEERWLFAIILHHLITDEWSTNLFVREVSAFYGSFVRGEPANLPPLPIQYADYARWQRQQEATPQWQAQLAAWREQLHGAPPLIQLPLDYPRPVLPTLDAATVLLRLDQALTAQLKALAQESGTTLYTTLLTAFALLLARYSQQRDLLIGSPVANRERAELEPLIGFLVNTLVQRIEVAEGHSFRSLLTAVRHRVLDNVANLTIPFERLVELMQPERHLNLNPLFQVMFVWQTDLHEVLELPGLMVELIDLPIRSLPVDLLLAMIEYNGEIIGRLRYSTDLFTEATAQEMAAHLQTLLATVVADPDQPLDRLPFYGGVGQQQLLAAGTGASEPELVTQTLHELFEAQVARDPAAPALYYRPDAANPPDGQASPTAALLSYGELNRCANQLAYALLARGCVAGERIAICVNRSPAMVAALFAVSKIGAAYVPLDPDYPAERLAYLLADAQATLLITERALQASLPVTATPLLVIDDLERQTLPDHNLAIPVPPSAQLYQIYTSGSTGLPKGVVVAHQGVANTIQTIAEQIGIGPGDRHLQFVPFGFDAAAIEFFTTLTRGAALVIHPNPTRLSAEELLQFCAEQEVTVVNFTVALWQQWVDNLALQPCTFPRTLRVFLTGGDKPSPQTLRTWATLGDHAMLYCCSYGPTEASITTTFYTITNDEVRRDPPALIPLGPPLPNVAIYLLDEAQRPVPRGVPGELYIGGMGVADGYWQRPALTAERFVELPPFGNADPMAPPLRLYRTGDLARWLAAPDGGLPICEFVGRVDTQIKIRGFRVELGEIESQLKQLPDVREAVVLARGNGAGDKQIVAYVQLSEMHPTPARPASGEENVIPAQAGIQDAGEWTPACAGVTPHEPLDSVAVTPARGGGREGVAWERIAHALRARLPAQMLPAAWVLIEAWPLTPHGKIDRQALPAPTFEERRARYVPPSTPLEAALVEIWQMVLGLAQVGVASNFFELGGHSLLATQVVARIQQRLALSLPLRTLFEKPTIAELAAALATMQPTQERPPLVAVERNGPLPLSFAQERLWLLQQIDPQSVGYNIPGALRLTGPLNLGALQRALDGIITRHESLRTIFVTAAEAPTQLIQPVTTVALRQIDLRHLPPDAREAAAQAEAATAMQDPFDLTVGPLLRCTLYHLADDDAILFVLMHHIITDGWSIPILLNELAELYAAQVEGRRADLPPLAIQYADYAQWQRKWLQGATLQAALDYWREQLAGAPPLLDLPTDRARPATPSFQAETLTFQIDELLVRQLNQLAHAHGATLYMTVLSAFAALLARYSQQRDLVIGTPIANRTHPAVEGLIGFFVNTLALRIDLAGDPNFDELLQRVRQTTLAAYAHQDAPFAQVVEALQLPRTLSYAPLFQVLLAWQSETGPAAPFELPGLSVAPVAWQKATIDYDLALSIAETDDALGVTWQYSTDLFDRQTMVQMVERFQTLLAALVAQPHQSLATLPLFGLAQLSAILAAGQGPTLSTMGNTCLHQLFEAQVEKSPTAPAIYTDTQVLRYAELNLQANQLAHLLLTQGYGHGDRIAICLDRSPAQVIATLAVLKSGAAYLPLDSAYPAERLAYMIDDAAVALLITAGAVVDRLPTARLPLLLIDQVELTAMPITNPPIAVAPSDPFYQIYTSGSTGLPKGVLVAHAGVANTIQATARKVAMQPADRLLQFIPVGFDAAALDLFLPLTSGASIVLHPQPTQLAAHELLELCCQQGVTIVNFSTAAWQQWVNNLALQGARFPSHLRLFLTGGEKPAVQTLQRWATLADHEMIFVSSYGPTEASITATIYLTTNHAVRRVVPALIPLGEPLPNVAIYLLDAACQPVVDGAPGELYIGGVGVNNDYWQRPALTAERFIRLPPFAGEAATTPPRRLYRTGDLARRLADGTFEFVGRVDTQVKIRGFRVELGEVENQIRQLPGVRAALVLTVAGSNGNEDDKQLVAYVEPAAEYPTPALPASGEGESRSSPARRGDWAGVTQWAALLKERLPTHMRPVAWVTVTEWPLTSNGKIDRQALPAPSFATVEESYVAPSTPLESTLAAIWQEVLGIEQIGVTTSFFALGGHSLSATQVVARLQQQLGVAVTLRTLFDKPTIAEFAVAVTEAAPAIARPPLLPVDRDAPLPLSFAQQRLWLMQQLNPTSGFFNMPAALWLDGDLDQAALQAAFDTMIQRHESLRTHFPLSNGAPVQQISDQQTLRIDHYPYLESDDVAAPNAALLAWVIAEAERPFALETGPLVRVALWQIRPQRHLLLVTLHHIIGDDWSRRIFMAEFSALYRAYATGEAALLPGLPVQYADFAQWQRAWLYGPLLQQQLDWWRTTLADAPPLLELPTDHPRPAQQRFVGERLTVAMAAPLAAGLSAFSRQAQSTLHMTLLTGFAALLARYSGMDDLVIGIPVAGRTDPQIEGLIGFFLNTLALRIRLHDGITFTELLAQVKAVTLDAYAHQDAPFEQVIEALNPTPQLNHTPIFQVIFDLMQADQRAFDLPGVEVQPVAFDMHSAKFDLNLVFSETADAADLTAVWEYNSDLFDRATVVRMAGHLHQLLQAALAAPTEPVSQLPMVSAVERQQLLTGWNEQARLRPPLLCMQRLFEAQVVRTPDFVAARHRAQSITYRQLNARANRWAYQLIGLGVASDVVVTPFWSRDIDFLTAILAIFKAGGAYLPLDPQTPSTRLAQILALSRSPLLLTNRDFLPLVESTVAQLPPEQRPRICLIEDLDAANAPSSNPPCRNRPDSLAYVIFTSGSTGVPKGVMVEQRGLVNHLAAMQQRLALGAVDIIGQTASQSYVISVWQFLAALTCGGSIRIVPEETLLDPAILVDEIAAQQISVVQVVPSLLRLLLEALQQRIAMGDDAKDGDAVANGLLVSALLPRLRWMIPTGEALPPALARRWFALCPQIPLLNAYGSSECSDDVAHDLIIKPPADDVVTMGIGRPIPNVQTYVLDAHRQPVPIGVAGELYVGGLGVGRGYLHDAVRTAQVFLANPFVADPSARLYKTGDRVRRLVDGSIEYLGRFDFQVKVRGIRVELGEIEATLSNHPAVAQAVVIANGAGEGEMQVIAYVIRKATTSIDSGGDPTEVVTMQALRRFLAEQLPDYMVPTTIIPLEALPLNSSGKVARRLLPLPTQLLDTSSEPYVAPRNEVEVTLVEILATVMGLDAQRIGVQHNFFDLGGHSMQAIQIVWQLREQFGVELPLRSIFEQTTVAQLANLVIDAQLAQLDDETLAALFAEVEVAASQ